MKKSNPQEQSLFKDYYLLYYETRELIYNQINYNIKEKIAINKEIQKKMIEFSQNIMNRIIFCVYAQHHGILPKDLIQTKIISSLEKNEINYNTCHIWENLCEIFQEIHRKYERFDIFALDFIKEEIKILDISPIHDFPESDKINSDFQLQNFIKKVGSLNFEANNSIILFKRQLNPIYTNFLLLSAYDYKNQINFEILSKIIEAASRDLDSVGENNSFRRSKGIYYTPNFVTEYIVESVLLFSLKNESIAPQSINQLLDQYGPEIDELFKKMMDLRIIDPSCGSGVFLITAFDYLVNCYQKIYQYCKKQKILTNYQHILEDKKTLIKMIIEKKIFGVDILKSAIESIELLMVFKIIEFTNEIIVLNHNFKVGDSLVDSSFSWENQFKEIYSNGSEPGFNVVIGNPPWGGKLNSVLERPDYYLQNYITAKSQFDTFSLFIERVVRKILALNGYFSFIIPNELCTNISFAELRQFLLKNTHILQLVNLGEGIFEEVNRPSLIFILQKIKTSSDDAVGLAHVNDKKKFLVEVRRGYTNNDKFKLKNRLMKLGDFATNSSNSLEIYSRSYESFFKNDFFVFDIYRTEKDREIIERIRLNDKIVVIGDLMQNGRGFDFNKEGKYIFCYQCKTGNPYYGRGNSRTGSGSEEKRCCNCGILLPRDQIDGMPERNLQKPSRGIVKSAFSNQKSHQIVPIAVGEDLQLLSLKPPSRFIDPYNPDLNKFDLKLSNEDHLYRGERIFIRKVGNPLVATIVDQDLMCNDQCYVWKLRSKYRNYSHYYCLAILLSHFQFYYYTLQTGNIEKEVFPHFRQEDIKRFPIPLIDSNSNQRKLHDTIVQQMKELIDWVDKYKKESESNRLEKMNSKEIENAIIRLENEINDRIYELFGFNESIAGYIENRIKTFDFKSIFEKIANKNQK